MGKTRQEKRREQKDSDRRERLRQARRPREPKAPHEVSVPGTDETAQKLRGMAKIGAVAYLVGEDRRLLAAYLPGDGWLSDGGAVSLERAVAWAGTPGVTFGLLRAVDWARDENLGRVREAFNARVRGGR